MRDLDWLREELAAIDRVFWRGQLEDLGVTICWGRWRRPAKHWFRYGCYRPASKAIEINPVLQNLWVPEEVVGLTVHHEGIHALQGPKVRSHESHYGHDRSFWAAELRYPHAESAYSWCDLHINELVAARPPSKP